MNVTVSPYSINDVVKADVTTSEASYNPGGMAYILHNAGDNIIYIDTATGVDATGWELEPGEKSIILNTKIFYKGAGTTTLKILVIEAL